MQYDYAVLILKLHNHSIICTRQELFENEGRFPKVVQCSVCSQLNNKLRVVVTDAPYLQ